MSRGIAAAALFVAGLATCAPQAAVAPCNDDNACTREQACVDGACVAAAAPAERDDAGRAVGDAGLTALDAGAAPDDAGSEVDAGAAGDDAGDALADAGVTAMDGGGGATDAGDVVPADGGDETDDGGAVPTDGGFVSVDGGTLPTDGGLLPPDGGIVPVDGGTGALGEQCANIDDCASTLVCNVEEKCALPPSCKALLQHGAPPASGTYALKNGSAWCDMERAGGGWTRVAVVDAPTSGCPADWIFDQTTNLCSVAPGLGGAARSAFFTTAIVDGYEEVGGVVVAHKKGSTDAFGYHAGAPTLDEEYVDGVSITIMNSLDRHHVFSFAASISDDASSSPANCPCAGGLVAPSYVGLDYVCEAGAGSVSNDTWYLDDPLWSRDAFADCDVPGDGPYFFSVGIGDPSTSDVEARVMVDEEFANEDVGVESMELYVR